MLSMWQKVVDNIFLFLIKKRPKPKFWQAQRESFLNYRFGAPCHLSQRTLPSCLCPSLPQDPRGLGGKAATNFKPGYGERWEIESSLVVNTHVLFKINNFSQQCLFGLLSFQRALRAMTSWHCCCGIVATPANQDSALQQWMIHLETISPLSLTCERFIPFRRKIYIHHTDVGCTIPHGVRTIALEGMLRALPSAKAVVLKKSEKDSSGSCLDSCHFPKLLPFNLCILPVSLKGINVTSLYPLVRLLLLR